jgi:tRNA(His) guanylyltransferase
VKRSDFEREMREMEFFHPLRMLKGVYYLVRVDGRSFTKFTASLFEKPFDPRFHALMQATAMTLLEELQGVYAYTESDEISVLLPLGWDLFDCSVEKVVSLSAAIATHAFTRQMPALMAERGAPERLPVTVFDSRVILAAREERVVDYFLWRQADADRSALNGWCYWTLRKEGVSPREAESRLNRQSAEFKHELLFQRGIKYAEDVPGWQRRGSGLYWETYEKTGFNPKTGAETTARRRRIRVDEELPRTEEYAAFLGRLLSTPSNV